MLVLLATILLLLCPCPDSLIKEFLPIFFNIVLDWFFRSSYFLIFSAETVSKICCHEFWDDGGFGELAALHSLHWLPSHFTLSILHSQFKIKFFKSLLLMQLLDIFNHLSLPFSEPFLTPLWFLVMWASNIKQHPGCVRFCIAAKWCFLLYSQSPL